MLPRAIGHQPCPMMHLAAVVTVVVGGAVVAACGGGDAAGSTDGAEACVARFNADRSARVLASASAPGADVEPPAHGSVVFRARMAMTEKDDCVLLAGPDPSVLHRIKSVSGQMTWTSTDRTINAEAQRLEEAARASDDAVEGTLASFDILTAQTDPRAGRFTVKRER
jgi:hypothetical protein